jgi:hypothetical protein
MCNAIITIEGLVSLTVALLLNNPHFAISAYIQCQNIIPNCLEIQIRKSLSRPEPKYVEMLKEKVIPVGILSIMFKVTKSNSKI